METTVVQVPDVPVDVVARLKARADARGESLSAFLRDLLAQEASMPSADDVMAGIEARDPICLAAEDLRAFREDGRP
jgi:plasmid stability protein